MRGIACIAALCALVLAGCEPLGPDELQREVESIGSVAAEGSVLAGQVANQNTKRTFARVQSRELADEAEHSAERLVDAHPGDGLERQTQRAIGLAEETSDAIGSLEAAPDDAARAAETARRLGALSDRAAALAAEL